MKRLSLLFLFLFLTCYISSAQTDLELKQQYQLDLIKEKQNAILGISSNQPSETVVLRDPLDDTDDDGMDDDWETDNGLDPTDPFDAWLDNDGDHVLNLFEFQLNSLPNNSNSPAVIEFSEGAFEADIDVAVESAASAPVVLRFSEGTYTFATVEFFNTDYHLMVQGGWNDDFTEYDPDEYETVLTNENDEIFTLGGSGFEIEESGVVFDGVTVSRAGAFFLGGGLQLWRHGDQTIDRTSIYNCRFVNNNFYGLGLTHKDAEALSDVFIVKTTFGNNPMGGIYTQITNGKNARWRVINCTFHNPGSSDGGIDGLTADESMGSRLAIENTNTINYGNDNFSFNFFADDSLIVTANYSTIDAPVATVIIEETNAVNTDPLFEDVADNDFFLTENSPLVDAGIDVGLLYGGNAPDIGAEELNEPSSSQEINNLDFSIYPNVISNGNFNIQVNGIKEATYQLSIFNIAGTELYNSSVDFKGNSNWIFVPANLKTGTYFVRLINELNEVGTQIFWVIE